MTHSATTWIVQVSRVMAPGLRMTRVVGRVAAAGTTCRPLGPADLSASPPSPWARISCVHLPSCYICIVGHTSASSASSANS